MAVSTVNNPKDVLPEDIRWLYDLRTDVWEFLSKAVWTQDQTDKVNPVKKYPSDDPYAEQLHWISDQIVAEPLLAIVKHRRMLMTWTACAVMLWDAIFNEERFIAIMSKKEEDSDDLIRRCKFIWENIPKSVMPIKPKFSYKYCELRSLDNGSVIKGFAQGADQLRQFTCSRIFADEIGFWPNAEESFVGMKPTLQGGGKVVLISTRFPGFFQDLIEDTMDDR